MKLFLTIALVLLLVFLLSIYRQLQGSASERAAPPGETDTGTDIGRRLRERMLTISPDSMGITPTETFPRTYAVLMDWPLVGVIVSIFAGHDGSASLYTTGTLSIIGAGETSASVRTEAITFVQLADRFFDAAAPTADIRYSGPDSVRFFLLTFTGLRVIEADRRTLEKGASEHNALFDQGQVVMRELRKLYDERQ